MLTIRRLHVLALAHLTGLAITLLALEPLVRAQARDASAQASTNAPPVERGPLVTAIQMRGVQHVDPKELLAGIATKASSCRTFLYTPICWFTKSDLFYQKHFLDALELRRDALRIRLYYWLRGYRDTRVTTSSSPSGGGAKVVFNVTEGPPTIVDRIGVRGVDSIVPRRIVRGSLQLKEKAPLDLILLDSSVAKLRREFFDRGYADASIELDTGRISNAANHGPIALIVHHGVRTTVKKIEIEGDSLVSERTIRRLLTFKEGDLFRRKDVLESQRNLYLSGMFAEVDMDAPPPPPPPSTVASDSGSAQNGATPIDSARRDSTGGDSLQSDSARFRARRMARIRDALTRDTAKVIHLRVAEGKLQQLDLTTGFSTADFAQFETALTRYNFLGGGRRVTLRGTLANIGAPQLSGNGPFYDVTNAAKGSARNAFLSPTWAASIDFTQPWLFSARNQLGSSIFAHRRTIPGIAIDRGKGATLALTREHGQRVSSTFGYTYEASTVDASDVYFCVTFGVCVTTSIDAVSKGNAIAPIALTTIIDRSNDALSPSTGYRGRLELEHASAITASEFHYNRISVTASRYFRLSPRNVLAGRLRLGWVGALGGTAEALKLPQGSATDIIHPRKRFFAGGSQSVRGFAENQLGPRVLTIAPEKLTTPRDPKPAPCTTQQIVDASCDPNNTSLEARDFAPQPLGGTSVLEGTVEYRFPLRFYEGLSGALFIDGALIGTDRFSNILGATGAITPGFGIRLSTPVGPVRLDLGIRPTLSEDLPVITQITDSLGHASLVTLKKSRAYDPVNASGNILRQILGRLMLHLSVGPPF